MNETRSQQLRRRSLEQLENVPKEEVLSWKQHPQTRGLLLGLEADIEAIKEGWADGAYSTEEKNAKMVGMIQGINSVIEWLETLEENLDDISSGI